MKKFLCLIAVFSLLICNSVVSINANEYDEVIIIDGDGSFDDPYEIVDNNNEIIEFINENYDRINAQSNQRGLSSGSTTVNTSITISSTGAYWDYTGGGGSVAYNGTLVYTLIDYINHSKLGDMCALALLSNTRSALGLANNTTNVNTAVDYLVNASIDEAVARYGMLPGIGFAATVYGGIKMLSTFISAAEDGILAGAQLNRKHLMIVHFKTSYNGSWYKYSRIEEATYKDYPQIPQSAYGNGDFENSGRLSN